MIKPPTIGQVVLFYDVPQLHREGDPPRAAIVCKVGEHRVSLAVFDYDGSTYGRWGIPLYSGEGDRPPLPYAERIPDR